MTDTTTADTEIQKAREEFTEELRRNAKDAAYDQVTKTYRKVMKAYPTKTTDKAVRDAAGSAAREAAAEVYFRAANWYADEYGSNDEFRDRHTFVHEMPGDDENVSLGNGMVTSRWNVRYDEHQERIKELFPEWLKADGEINTTAEDRARAAARRAASEAG